MCPPTMMGNSSCIVFCVACFRSIYDSDHTRQIVCNMAKGLGGARSHVRVRDWMVGREWYIYQITNAIRSVNRDPSESAQGGLATSHPTPRRDLRQAPRLPPPSHPFPSTRGPHLCHSYMLRNINADLKKKSIMRVGGEALVPRSRNTSYSAKIKVNATLPRHSMAIPSLLSVIRQALQLRRKEAGWQGGVNGPLAHRSVCRLRSRSSYSPPALPFTSVNPRSQHLLRSS
jgi:hypothetical protein